MSRPVAGCVLVAALGATAAAPGLAQSSAEAPPPGVQPAGLTSFLVSRRTSTRPIPYGHETTVDDVRYGVVPYNWQGGYVGLHGGGAWGKARTDNTAPFGGFDAAGPVGHSLDPAGAFGGGQFGVIQQSGNWVYGAEIDIGYLGLDRTANVGSDRVSVRYDWYGTLTGRFGFAWDHALYYLKAGGALAQMRNTATDIEGTPPGADPGDISQVSKRKLGWAVGAGIEYGMAPNWSAKVEYLYMDFGSISSSNLDGDTFRHRNSAHTVKLGVNYRFGGVPLFIRF